MQNKLVCIIISRICVDVPKRIKEAVLKYTYKLLLTDIKYRLNLNYKQKY